MLSGGFELREEAGVLPRPAKQLGSPAAPQGGDRPSVARRVLSRLGHRILRCPPAGVAAPLPARAWALLRHNQPVDEDKLGALAIPHVEAVRGGIEGFLGRRHHLRFLHRVRHRSVAGVRQGWNQDSR